MLSRLIYLACTVPMYILSGSADAHQDLLKKSRCLHAHLQTYEMPRLRYEMNTFVNRLTHTYHDISRRCVTGDPGCPTR